MLANFAGKRRVALVGATCFVSLMVSGCSAGPESVNSAKVDGGSSGATRGQALRSSVHLELPIQEYLFSDADLKTVKQAMRTLAQRCMRRYDVSYDFGPPAPALGPRSLMDRRYGLTDEQLARTSGYHLGDRDPRTHPVTPPVPPVGEALTVLSGKERPVEVNGVKVPAHGCAGEAEKKIAGSGRLGSGDLAQGLNGRSFLATKADRRVTKVFRAWSECMKGKGFSYPDPLSVMDDKRFQGRTPVPEEKKVATADVACKGRTNVVGVWFGVETAYQKSLIAKNASALGAALEAKESQLAAAAAVNSTE